MFFSEHSVCRCQSSSYQCFYRLVIPGSQNEPACAFCMKRLSHLTAGIVLSFVTSCFPSSRLAPSFSLLSFLTLFLFTFFLFRLYFLHTRFLTSFSHSRPRTLVTSIIPFSFRIGLHPFQKVSTLRSTPFWYMMRCGPVEV
jgi:hypothetical protein